MIDDKQFFSELISNYNEVFRELQTKTSKLLSNNTTLSEG